MDLEAINRQEQHGRFGLQLGQKMEHHSDTHQLDGTSSYYTDASGADFYDRLYQNKYF